MPMLEVDRNSAAFLDDASPPMALTAARSFIKMIDMPGIDFHYISELISFRFAMIFSAAA